MCGSYYPLRGDGLTLYQHMREIHNANERGVPLDDRGVMHDYRLVLTEASAVNLAAVTETLHRAFPHRIDIGRWDTGLGAGRCWPQTLDGAA